MNVFLKDFDADRLALKKAIELCKEDTVVANVLEKYLISLNLEFNSIDGIRSNYLTKVKEIKIFSSSLIFYDKYNDLYTIEIYFSNISENIKYFIHKLREHFVVNFPHNFEIYILDKKKDSKRYEARHNYDFIEFK